MAARTLVSSFGLVTTPAFDFALLATFRSYALALRERAGWRLAGAVGLMFIIGLLDGGGLLLLLPLFRALGIPAGGLSGFPAGWAFESGVSLTLLLAAFVVLKAGQAALRAWSGLVNLKLETDFTCELRARFYRAMMSANWLFVTRQRSSDVTQALLHELPNVGAATQMFLSLLGLGLLCLVQIAVALLLSPAMTLLALSAGAIVALGLRTLRRRAHRHAREGHGRRAEMASVVTEHLAGIKIAKSHGREERHYHHFMDAMRAIVRHSLGQFRFTAVTQIWTQAGAAIALGLFVWFALEIRHVATAQVLVLAFTFSRLLGFVSSLQGMWHTFTIVLPTFDLTERLRERLVAAAEPPRPAETQRVNLREAVRLTEVSFRYDETKDLFALRGATLAIPARRVTALCGPSGAGKSTVADLVLGLLSPSQGSITIDGLPLNGSRLHDWRQSIGYVPQEIFLFHDTVRANLLWARPEASEADLRAALNAAAATAFVDRLPQGLDTVVGDRGVRLSGGERQRIALARALLRRPTLLVLDEATSSLDPENERLVQDAIERLHGELTILLIAHRLSTVRMADNIVVLSQGAIAESGTWDQLCAREEGTFRRLVAADTAK